MSLLVNFFIYYIFVELAQDDYLAVNGARSGSLSDKAYTLSRLRKEERGIDTNVITEEREDLDNDLQGSNYEIVDEVYENMNSFDKRLKTLKSGTINRRFET